MQNYQHRDLGRVRIIDVQVRLVSECCVAVLPPEIKKGGSEGEGCGGPWVGTYFIGVVPSSHRSEFQEPKAESGSSGVQSCHSMVIIG